MKINQIHELNMIGILMLTDKIGSAVEYYLNHLVELKKCIRDVERLRIKFDERSVVKEENVISEISSRDYI